MKSHVEIQREKNKNELSNTFVVSGILFFVIEETNQWPQKNLLIKF